MTKFIWVLTLCLVFLKISFANEKYQIDIHVQSYTDSTLLLTSYFGDKIKLIDTAYINEEEHFIFEGEPSLPGGIYMVISPGKKKLFEFLVNQDQVFSLSTDTIGFVQEMQVKGSKENEIFFEYLKYNEGQYKANERLGDQLKAVDAESEQADRLKKQIDSINQSAINYKLEIIEHHPDMLVSRVFNAMRELEIPDSISQSNDSTLAFKYYKTHYWDYFDLSDSRLLRTPILTNKVTQYFDQTVVFHPDSVIAAIDLTIAQARPSKEVVSFLVWHYVAKYQNPKYMGFDKVFVHLSDTYFSKEPIDNTTPSILKSIQDRANKIRPILLGEPAPNLILIDTTGGFTSFTAVKDDYIVLFFWDFECGICKQEIDELKKVVVHPKYDIGVYAINVNGDIEKWKESIHEKKLSWINVNGTRSVTADFHDLYDIYGTPVIYLLDKERKIVAKRIGADQIIPFLENKK